MTPVTVIRHPKERISKCSLRHLHDREDFTFRRAKPGFFFDATDYLLLSVDAPVLATEDVGRPLLLLDATWKLLPQVASCVTGKPVRRSLPALIRTAYPRVSKVSEDPVNGLASVEALFAAKLLLGEADLALLEGYHWRDVFLENLREAGYSVESSVG